MTSDNGFLNLEVPGGGVRAIREQEAAASSRLRMLEADAQAMFRQPGGEELKSVAKEIAKNYGGAPASRVVAWYMLGQLNSYYTKRIVDALPCDNPGGSE